MYVMIDGSCIQYGQSVLKVYAVRESLLAIRHDFCHRMNVRLRLVGLGLG